MTLTRPPHRLLRALLFGLATALALPAAASPPSGLNPAHFDPAVRAQDDLYRATNGRWLRDTPIPADKSEYGTFSILADRADAQVRAIAETQAAQPHGRIGQQVGDFYASHLDSAAIDQLGMAPAQAVLREIDALSDAAALAAWFGRHQRAGTLPLSLDVQPDFKAPRRYALTLWQSGLGLPDRDYYLSRDAKMARVRAAYQRYLASLARHAGLAQPDRVARQVLALETDIARAHRPAQDNRNPEAIYHPTSVAELVRRAGPGGFDWRGFLQAAEVGRIDTVVVSQPETTTRVITLLRQRPLALWKQYAALHWLDAHANVLPAPLREAHFALRGRVLSGATQPKPRWQQSVSALNDALGHGVGQLYVAEHFPPGHKAKMLQLVEQLMAAYRESIDGLTWMTPATRVAAQEKLAKITVKIGYPDRWRDHSALTVTRGDALGNAQRAAAFEWSRVAAKAGQAVDRSEWLMTPQTVNAYYDPTLNEIVFPAAILQAPLFQMDADDAVNYGAIGAIIGHEISHSFDDEGAKFDGDGVLRNWWTPADRAAFDAIGQRLVAQYAAYEPLPGQRVNGQLTLGENIADLSGLQIAYKAYQRSLNGREAPVIDGLTGSQRFFMGWASGWAEHARPERTLQLLLSDPHSPPRFRTNGAAINHDGYHRAFATRPGDKMHKPEAERIRLW